MGRIVPGRRIEDGAGMSVTAEGGSRGARRGSEADDSNRLALELQQAIMPTSRPPVGARGLQIAVRYRPAESRHLVGGDWYDAIPLPPERTLVSIGDIAGHGMQAATDMIVLRNALRGLAATGAGPGQLLGWLNNVTLNLPGPITATALCGLYDPRTRILRWARAGHPPPVLLHDGEATALPMIGGLLLGAAPDVDYEEGELELAPGDTLIMYTDGLIESRARTFQQSLDDLLELAASPRPTLEGHLDDLLIHSTSDTDDDTCVIGIRAH
jgi:serine phosphatase RsbU (regulator of sigma subunit)